MLTANFRKNLLESIRFFYAPHIFCKGYSPFALFNISNYRIGSYLIHFYASKGHRHWIRFAPDLTTAEKDAKGLCAQAGYEYQKTELCDDPTLNYPTRSELAQAGIGTRGFYVGPLDFMLACGLANELNDTGFFDPIIIVRQDLEYNIAEVM